MKKLTLNNEVYQVPESFTECSEEQVSKILVAQSALYRATEIHAITRTEDIKLSILFILIPVNKKIFKLLTPAQKVQIMNLVRWAFTAKVTTKPFDYFALRQAQGDEVKYYLPAPDYEDTSSLEWALITIYYIAYTNDKIAAVLRQDFFFKLIALLCRPARKDLQAFKNDPKRWNGDVREPFNGVSEEERAVLFRKADMGKLIAVYQYWEAMNEGFLKRNKELFEADGEQIFYNGEGCLSLLADVAEEGVMGTLNDVYDVAAPELFMYLRQKQKKVQKAERDAIKDNSE